MSRLLILFAMLQPDDPPDGGGYDLPDPPPAPPPGLEQVGSDLVSWAKWAGGIACVLGIVACVVMMAVGRRNRSDMAASGAMGIPWVIVAAILLGVGAGMVSILVNTD